MPIQVPQWNEYLTCPICFREYTRSPRSPINLGCGHTLCKVCLTHLNPKQCPFDQATVSLDADNLVINTALLQLLGIQPSDKPYHPPFVQSLPEADQEHYDVIVKSIEDLAKFLKYNGNGSKLSKPMQRKLVNLMQCTVLEEDGRGKTYRAVRSLAERTVTEIILHHQNPQQLGANLWAAVRARGCQFLGPAMQEEVLKLVLLALEDGSALSRKVLVMFVVQRLETRFPQASKTSIGHVVQLLYRASCFKVSKRESDSSLMQLKEEFRTYDNLRREHDSQIVQIATEAGLRIAPDQWSSLLYGDPSHKSHMQSIIDKLQTPQSFGQSVQELMISYQRSGDPTRAEVLSPRLQVLTTIDPSPDSSPPSWAELANALCSVRVVVNELVLCIYHQVVSLNKDINQNPHPIIPKPPNVQLPVQVTSQATTQGNFKNLECEDGPPFVYHQMSFNNDINQNPQPIIPKPPNLQLPVHIPTQDTTEGSFKSFSCEDLRPFAYHRVSLNKDINENPHRIPKPPTLPLSIQIPTQDMTQGSFKTFSCEGQRPFVYHQVYLNKDADQNPTSSIPKPPNPQPPYRIPTIIPKPLNVPLSIQIPTTIPKLPNVPLSIQIPNQGTTQGSFKTFGHEDRPPFTPLPSYLLKAHPSQATETSTSTSTPMKIPGYPMMPKNYKVAMCNLVAQGRVCFRGAGCYFAHSEEEQDLYRGKQRRRLGIHSSANSKPNYPVTTEQRLTTDGLVGAPNPSTTTATTTTVTYPKETYQPHRYPGPGLLQVVDRRNFPVPNYQPPTTSNARANLRFPLPLATSSPIPSTTRFVAPPPKVSIAPENQNGYGPNGPPDVSTEYMQTLISVVGLEGVRPQDFLTRIDRVNANYSVQSPISNNNFNNNPLLVSAAQRDMFVRSDSILTDDSDCIPFESQTTGNNFGPISRGEHVRGINHMAANSPQWYSTNVTQQLPIYGALNTMPQRQNMDMDLRHLDRLRAIRTSFAANQQVIMNAGKFPSPEELRCLEQRGLTVVYRVSPKPDRASGNAENVESETESTTQSEEDTYEVGIAKDIKELELKWESELEEVEKKWSKEDDTK